MDKPKRQGKTTAGLPCVRLRVTMGGGCRIISTKDRLVWWRRKVPKEITAIDFGEAMDEVSARPEYQLLQDEAILFNASQSKEFDDEQGEEAAYSDGEDEDTDLMFGYDEVDRDNSEVASDQAEADENHHADQASKVWDESDTPLFIEFLELLYQVSILLVFFSGILGFSEDCKQFLLARQFCPHLSGLIYIQRLLLMECALPLREYHGIAIPPRLHADQLDQLNSIREKYMITGTQYPLAEMVSLRDFGRNIARTEPPSLLFSWSDDGETIRHGDFQLTMDKFRQVPDYFISQAEEICDKLMFDLKPDIDLAMIKDDMANSSSGYSFVKHPANDLDKAYLDLLYSAYASRESKLSKDGRWIWKSMDSYLKQVTKLDEMLAGDLYTACGQTPRARDLFTLACESGPSTSCSISIWNGLMGYVLRHHKAKRQMGREFYVVRFLPSRLAHVMYKYLVYFRRFAALSRREQQTQAYPYHHERLLFHSSGKPWCTSRLTSILKQATSGIWQREVNIRIFRQMAISITEKHFREVHSPLNTYDDTTADADLNAVFAWQSGDRPLQRGITYGLDGAFPNRLQPALLRSYEWASTRWHEFIHQPSRVISSPRGRTTSPSKLSLSIATLKRNFACLMQSDESLGYRSMSAKKKGKSQIRWGH
ncbi:Pogo transposable element with ZNF domain protein [Fusarium oxysporum f. sp. albedinis]|nr:Pogo transposable element with ZNF domain protein [Fusarium oxysporum f. sp. albedinis]